MSSLNRLYRYISFESVQLTVRYTRSSWWILIYVRKWSVIAIDRNEISPVLSKLNNLFASHKEKQTLLFWFICSLFILYCSFIYLRLIYYYLIWKWNYKYTKKKRKKKDMKFLLLPPSLLPPYSDILLVFDFFYYFEYTIPAQMMYTKL